MKILQIVLNNCTTKSTSTDVNTNAGSRTCMFSMQSFQSDIH
jgi:hypothetical protein